MLDLRTQHFSMKFIGLTSDHSA